MQCLLTGHVPNIHNGYGQHEGSKFWVCVHCGKTEPYIPGEVPMMLSVSKQQAQASEMGEQ